MERNVIIQKVKVKLDELTPFDEGLAVALPNADIKPIESYINETLEEACVEVLLSVPLHKLTPERVSAPIAIPDGAGSGYIDCPDDFLRLYSLKMEGWEREVQRPLSEGSLNYKLQRNKHTRGGVAKPAVVLNHRNTGDKQLVYYSLPYADNHRVEKLLYIPLTLAEDMPANLIDLLVWVCTRKVLEVLDRKEAELANNEVARLLTLENY